MKAPKVKAALFGSHTLGWRWELPADAESYEQIIEQFWNRCLRMYEAGSSMNQAVRAGFKEIGITAPKRGKKGSK